MTVQRVRIFFAKRERVRYISHLDVLRYWERAIRRAGLPLSYSQGFTAHPKLQFAGPLPLGYLAEREVVDVSLDERVPLSEIAGRLAPQTVPDLPMLDVGYGVTSRFQVSASVPFYRASFEGTTQRGLDDMYIGGKFTAIDPDGNDAQFGLAVSPVLEVLSAGAPDGRMHFAVPVSVELRRQPYRIYGSAGYFTRGALFSGAAIEWASAAGLVFTGAFTQSYSTKDDPLSDQLGIGKQRMDMNVGVAYPLTQSAVTYVSVGRSLTSLEEGGTSLGIAGGVSFRLAPVRSTP